MVVGAFEFVDGFTAPSAVPLTYKVEAAVQKKFMIGEYAEAFFHSHKLLHYGILVI